MCIARPRVCGEGLFLVGNSKFRWILLHYTLQDGATECTVSEFAKEHSVHKFEQVVQQLQRHGLPFVLLDALTCLQQKHSTQRFRCMGVLLRWWRKDKHGTTRPDPSLSTLQRRSDRVAAGHPLQLPLTLPLTLGERRKGTHRTERQYARMEKLRTYRTCTIASLARWTAWRIRTKPAAEQPGLTRLSVETKGCLHARLRNVGRRDRSIAGSMAPLRFIGSATSRSRKKADSCRQSTRGWGVRSTRAWAGPCAMACRTRAWAFQPWRVTSKSRDAPMAATLALYSASPTSNGVSSFAWCARTSTSHFIPTTRSGPPVCTR
eukprot:m.1278367 g.1278367  ORF g.1278367 m.1278367 type:complete len:320 (-) comp24764_c0_seq62:3166-4125(-)